jgi:hypothetical protein
MRFSSTLLSLSLLALVASSPMPKKKTVSSSCSAVAAATATATKAAAAKSTAVAAAGGSVLTASAYNDIQISSGTAGTAEVKDNPATSFLIWNTDFITRLKQTPSSPTSI